MGERARPPHDISPERFFTEWVGAAVASDGQRRTRLGDTRATIEFLLTGDAGGAWVIQVDAGDVSGSSGPAEAPDLQVRLDVATWRALNRGEISAPQALLKRRVHLRGDFLLALKLHLILG